MDDFLSNFMFEGGLLAVATDRWENFTYYDTLPTLTGLGEREVWFGPGMRKARGNTKEDILGTRALWVDADDPTRPLATLPPSAMVLSGHGWHLYWFLESPLLELGLIEALNQTLAADVPTGDAACWNVNRILRVPGTINKKNPAAPVDVILKVHNGLRYAPDDIVIVGKLSKQVKHKIRTGDSRGYRSRSERDWAIVTDLVAAGATDQLIFLIFQNQPCGDKFRDAPDNYLEHTIQKVRERTSTAGSGKGKTVEKRDDGYYVPARNGMRRVSTFTIDPQILLDGSSYGAEDAIVCQVNASGYTWQNQTFTRSAFTSVPRIDRETPVAAWQWLGRDEDLRLLLPYLLSELQEKGLPKVRATNTMGLHFIHGVPYFLGTQQVLSQNEFWEGYSGPIAWLPAKREHPVLDLTPNTTEDELELLKDLIPQLNEPEAVWPLVGWYAATPLKPWLESHGYRFPILNVVGTKGSGKTTLIQRVMMPLFGQIDPKSYDAGTTRFVTLALMGASNAVPVAFSEFRYDSVEKFIRFILLAYDTGHDPRGKGDQTTVDYPLSAPFSVDGEDLIEDPAARERIVVVHLHPNAIDEGSISYAAYNTLRDRLPKNFGGHYIRMLLRKITSCELDQLLLDAREEVFDSFPSKLPDRVRANHVVAHLGCMLFCDAINHPRVPASVMTRSLASVYNLKTGRSRTISDSMVEDVANAASQGASSFRWVDQDGMILYFQLSSAHSWWLTSRRRQGRGALEQDAIRSQLKEAPYFVDTKVVDSTWMFGINLQKAQEVGLDVPSAVRKKQISFTF